MPYLDRLRDCTYTDPSGTVHPLLFDEVERSGEKKTGIFELPQQDRTEVQDLGMIGVRFTMSVYITGPDYDQEADKLFSGLSLRHTDDKPGILAHPRWGDITCKPLTFSQSESFVDGMGRAVFLIDFITVDVTAKFPASTENVGASIKTASETTATTAIDGFDGPETANEISIVAANAVEFLKNLRTQLSPIAAISEEISAALESGITQAIDGVADLVDDPAGLAQIIVDLTRLPASTEGSISQKISAYSALFVNTATSFTNGNASDPKLLSLILSATALGSAESSTAGELINRDDAISASDLIAELLAYYQSMMDLVGTDADMIAQTIDLLTMAQGYLLEKSFGLKSARRKILDHNSDPISQTFALYGTIDMVSQFISDNKLQENEFFVLPIGREIVWYE